jgi:hypothetical protein
MTIANNVERPTKTRGLTAITGVMSLIAVLLIVQIWLLSAALESFLAGRRGSALPGAIFSGVMFLISFGLYLFVDRLDSNIRDSSRER